MVGRGADYVINIPHPGDGDLVPGAAQPLCDALRSVNDFLVGHQIACLALIELLDDVYRSSTGIGLGGCSLSSLADVWVVMAFFSLLGC
jgi:hypothetical protein